MFLCMSDLKLSRNYFHFLCIWFNFYDFPIPSLFTPVVKLLFWSSLFVLFLCEHASVFGGNSFEV